MHTETGIISSIPSSAPPFIHSIIHSPIEYSFSFPSLPETRKARKCHGGDWQSAANTANNNSNEEMSNVSCFSTNYT